MASTRIPPYAKPQATARRNMLIVDQPIVLVGMMGAGKSSVGRRLARRLRLPFVDADDAIEEAHDLSISEIFERFGEAYFRDGERRVIDRLMDGKPKIIATGGGAFCQPETQKLILEQALSVWIDAEIATLVERVSRRGGRPLLENRDPEQVLRELAEKRNGFYSEADIRVISDHLPAEKMVDRIIRAMKDYTTRERRNKRRTAARKQESGKDLK